MNIIKRIYRNRNAGTGALILRILLGILFISSAWMKLSDMDMTVKFFVAGGFTAFQAYLVAWTELIGGALVVIGLLQKPAIIALAVIMTAVVWGTPGQPYNIFFGHN